MRTPSTSVESPTAQSDGTFALPDADLVRAAWIEDPVAAGFPTRPDMAKTLSLAMLALGFALVLFVPIGAALLLVAGVLGLTIASSPTDQ